tara:strand:- start:112 stop:882 length:771 start_codon:yes stop_codon:yes gene_type:complete
MFGPSKEVQQIIDDIKSLIKKNWKIFEEQGSNAFENSEFINVILSWRDESHPTKLFGGFKEYEDFFFGKDIAEEETTYIKKSLKQIAYEVNDPHDSNSGEGWRQIDFEKELILYLHVQKSAGQSGLILTNQNLYLFMCKNKLMPASVIKILPISDLYGTSISIKTAITGIHGVLINNELAGYMTIEIDPSPVDVMRSLLNAACNRAPKAEKSQKTVASDSDESALDKIKKLKELLDMGAISEEEFEKKKIDLMDKL